MPRKLTITRRQGTKKGGSPYSSEAPEELPRKKGVLHIFKKRAMDKGEIAPTNGASSKKRKHGLGSTFLLSGRKGGGKALGQK